jgi:hypothetical protein
MVPGRPISWNRSGSPYEDEDKPALRELIGRFCSLLGQEAMYLEFADTSIEFIPPPEEA